MFTKFKEVFLARFFCAKITKISKFWRLLLLPDEALKFSLCRVTPDYKTILGKYFTKCQVSNFTKKRSFWHIISRLKLILSKFYLPCPRAKKTILTNWQFWRFWGSETVSGECQKMKKLFIYIVGNMNLWGRFSPWQKTPLVLRYKM